MGDAKKPKPKKKTVEEYAERLATVPPHIVKALGHELRRAILGYMLDPETSSYVSPNELSKELDEGLSQVSYHIKVLKEKDEAGVIQLVKTEPRRGAVEHYYKPTDEMKEWLAEQEKFASRWVGKKGKKPGGKKRAKRKSRKKKKS